MTDPSAADLPTPEHATPNTLSHQPKRTMVAWIAVIVITAFIFGTTFLLGDEAVSTTSSQLAGAINEFQGKYVVGASSMFPMPADDLLGQGELNSGPMNQRHRYIVLVGDLKGSEAAREELSSLSQLMEQEGQGDESGDLVSETDIENHRILKQLYGDEKSHAENLESLTEAERDSLEESLGWYGKLALAPKDHNKAARDAVLAPARRTFLGAIGTFALAIPAFLLGLVGLFVCTVQVWQGKLRPKLPEGSIGTHIYIETFAIWLVALFGIQIVAGVVGSFLPVQLGLFPSLVGFFLSLLALYWPHYCGAKFSDVRRDIGWTMVRPPYLLPVYGVAGYFMALPMLLLGVLLTLLIIVLMSSGNESPLAPVSGPAHPIVLEIAKGNPIVILQVLLLAAVAAPIVEETMFRGVLYRHLRDCSKGFGVFQSVVFSGLLNAFIFAMIHPQGLAAVPALMSLAIAFTLAREFCDSVYPSMLMHGLSNSIVMMISVAIFAT